MQTTTRQAGPLTLRLYGRITVGRPGDRLPRIVQVLADEGARFVAVDLRGVTYMDATCLGEIVEAADALWRVGGHLELVRVPACVQRLLELSRLAALFVRPAEQGMGQLRRRGRPRSIRPGILAGAKGHPGVAAATTRTLN